ncbi:MAG: fructose-specific PTS transporter subunit EIIC [Anaerovoracaceae bacterium]|nr:fructose-specific PTS transporter subunit EIIC [Anaerovoracaceae bacterium]
MRISDLLKATTVKTGVQISSRDEAIDMLIDLHEKAGNLKDKAQYKEDILAREAAGTTAIGDGIAIPHAKSEAVKAAGLAAVTVPEGVDYKAPDGNPSNLVFMIAAPVDGDLHLEVLSRLMTLLMDTELREELLKATTAEAFIKAIDDKEKERYPEESKEAAATENTAQSGYNILAVTACPTGIAHTYMAAEALEKKAREMGYSLKAETNGSGGAKNVLTPEEIKAADGIIIAADKNVEMVRFDGKRVCKTNVSAGINKPEELINMIVEGKAPVYHYEGEKTTSTESIGGEGIGHKIYKHLMNGVSYMLPFVIGGGILIALAFLIDTIAGAPRDGNFGTYTQAAAFFKTIGGAAFNFMLPVLAGYIARSIADRPGLAVGFVGGYIATIGCTFANIGGDASAVSGFIGALIAGFVAGFIVLLLKKIFSFLPSSLESMMPVLIIPLLGVFLIGAFMCLINPVVGALNTAISDGLNSMGSMSQILLGCLLGGMMAIDMGGPFNKAAYVFGTAAIASGGFNIMAAVMIGGMVPPIAIALATTFFKNKFTDEERNAGVVNYIMGLCFITEGAIPFAASDPVRVIPSCIAGSAIAGGISMAMGCTLRAPHGGIFVFPVVGNVGGYLLALVVGSLVGMLLLGILKKKIK